MIFADTCGNSQVLKNFTCIYGYILLLLKSCFQLNTSKEVLQ